MKQVLVSTFLLLLLGGAVPAGADTIRIEVTSASGAEQAISGYFELFREGTTTQFGDFSITVGPGTFFNNNNNPQYEDPAGFTYDKDSARTSPAGSSFSFLSLESFVLADLPRSRRRDLRFQGQGSIASLYNLALEGSFTLDRQALECFNCSPTRILQTSLSYTAPAVIPLPPAGGLLLSGVASLLVARRMRRLRC